MTVMKSRGRLSQICFIYISFLMWFRGRALCAKDDRTCKGVGGGGLRNGDLSPANGGKVGD